MSKFLTKNEIQNHQREIRSTFALKDLITENNNLSPATFLTFCIISCRDIFLSCKNKWKHKHNFNKKKKPVTVTSPTTKSNQVRNTYPILLVKLGNGNNIRRRQYLRKRRNQSRELHKRRRRSHMLPFNSNLLMS